MHESIDKVFFADGEVIAQAGSSILMSETEGERQTVVIDVLLSKGGIGGAISGLLEGVGVPWPGALVLTAAGSEYTGLVNAAILGTMFAVAYTIGSMLQYWFGRCCRSLLERFLSADMKRRLDEAITKYGQAAVLWTRPLAVGNYISIPAGMMRMNPAKFLAFTFLGIWPWAFGMSLAGSMVTQYLGYVADLLPITAGAAAFIGLAAAGRKYVLARRARQRASYGD